MVATEEEQLNVILKYLPEQLSDEEISKLVQDGIAAVSAESMKDMGKFMVNFQSLCLRGKPICRLLANWLKNF